MRGHNPRAQTGEKGPGKHSNAPSESGGSLQSGGRRSGDPSDGSLPLERTHLRRAARA